jgi:DNA-binding response OmpR family regulator
MNDEREFPVETGLNILVVDDDPDIRFATVRLLGKAGYSVTEADTGEKGLCLVRQTHPDLVLLDVMLPDTDGYEICRIIKTDAELKDTYVILLSGKKTGSDDQSEGLEIGADGYVARPVSNRELLARVQSMVRIIRAERDRDRLIGELQEALANIRTLRGLLPICCHCKKIRDDKGYWSQLEKYIHEHSDAEFSHSICPDCLGKLYPDYV